MEDRCSVCGAEHTYVVLGSTNQFGSPDLDLRPPQMARSTMGLWVHKCPECGYVSCMVSDPTTVTREFLESEEYRTCGGIGFSSYLAARFYKDYLICLEEKKIREAFLAVLHAAWECDDEGDDMNAARCRVSLVRHANAAGYSSKKLSPKNL